ncbi:hypothetical protein M0R45_009625 [Rubus argutus]|uniref:Uncharacterized protein n=1 Tax=Rubus argutus TaxID=59490 RepID=A0AAW1Y490_RUBAR
MNPSSPRDRVSLPNRHCRREAQTPLRLPSSPLQSHRRTSCRRLLLAPLRPCSPRAQKSSAQQTPPRDRTPLIDAATVDLCHAESPCSAAHH